MAARKPSRRGGARPGAGRPRTTGRGDGPQTPIRWSLTEHAEVADAAGCADAVAMWGRTMLLALARNPELHRAVAAAAEPEPDRERGSILCAHCQDRHLGGLARPCRVHGCECYCNRG